MGGLSTAPQRVHRVSIAVNALRGLPVAGLIYLLVVQPQARASAWWLIGGLIVLAGALLVGAWLSWRNLHYFFDDSGDFRLDSGVVTRKQRRLALSRLQSVDIVRPFLARLFGMASLRIEVAGGGESTAVVEYLPQDRAEALRAQVLARAAGLRPQAPSAPEVPLLRIETGTLAASLLLRGSTVVAAAITLLGVTGILALTGPGGFLVVGFGVFVPVLAVLGEFATFANFTVATSPDGLRIRAGLLGTTAQTVPPGRVHAVEFAQSYLWRRFDWVRVNLSIAGTGLDVDGAGKAMPKVLLPVGTSGQARDLLAQLLPEWDPFEVPLQPAPPRARWRAWIQCRQLGHGWDDAVLVTRRGRFVRRTAAVPHARVQSVRLVQGPWQRRLGLATVAADTVPGPVNAMALHMDAAQARDLLDAEIGRMHDAAQRDGGGPAQRIQGVGP